MSTTLECNASTTSLSNCKHLESFIQQQQQVQVQVVLDDKQVLVNTCNICNDNSENWICIQLASLSDHSVWCYQCESYVEHPNLAPYLEILQHVIQLKSTTSTTSTSTSTTATASPSILKISTQTERLKSSGGLNKSSHLDNFLEFGDDEEDDELMLKQQQERQQGGGLIQAVMDMFFGSRLRPHPMLNELSLQGVANHIKAGHAKNIVVLTGAGISVAAGIPDFRSPTSGLYYNLEKYNLPYKTAIFDIEYFAENPKPFFLIAKELYPGNFQPTPVHHFIKLLHDKNVLLRNYTQNIDTLERQADVPDSKLVEAHGSFATSKCLSCKKQHSKEWVKDIIFKDEIPRCTECETGIVKPDIIFFGEPLPARFTHLAREDLSKCDLLLVIGTSLQVQPFASLLSMAPTNIPRCLINMHEVGTNAHGGFKFEASNNKTDVKWIGDCQQGIKELSRLLGWQDHLQSIINGNGSS
ncbi:hypothetical protein SAMD00019534_079100 [Acytostelium subglobosum LB1]|uniref:hypothetical protein n=1 Tax=Acytostelium subglobosum LB1 TaxID=1410327 RepID=UPI000644C908|nr:hypothetical protein SAMD00019534_079100 [Acytostelium subglobosum LB1]GAM24735.1 hypothetical protein SAMD00019534_079100 [Acytostelium subglobosum LB1]|eukprot:XP_012752404.1 hypothetical protein SAMD00019534_079100 [Acytostelium subglobosum LB1]